MKRAVLAGGFVLFAFGLVACSSEAGSTPPASPGGSTAATAQREFSPELKAMVACMEDEGFKIEPAIEGEGSATHESFESSYPEAQSHAYDRADEKCTKLTNWGAIPMDLTDEQAGKEFDDLVKVADCLESHGFAVAEPPSRQAFVGQLVAHNTIWFPYDSILKNGGSYADYQKALKLCPQKYTVP